MRGWSGESSGWPGTRLNGASSQSLSTTTSTNSKADRQTVSLFSEFLTNRLENLSDKNNWWAHIEWRNTKIISGHYEWFVARCSISDKNFDQTILHSNVEVTSISNLDSQKWHIYGIYTVYEFLNVATLRLADCLHPLICPSWIEDRGCSP